MTAEAHEQQVAWVRASALLPDTRSERRDRPLKHHAPAARAPLVHAFVVPVVAEVPRGARTLL